MKRIFARVLAVPAINALAMRFLTWLRGRSSRALEFTLGARRVPAGPAGIRELGHRAYVGGTGENWETIGRLQFDFLVERGLEPRHVLLDIACGALRAGVLLIPYLDKGHYLGLDRERLLIEAALEHELPAALRDLKSPEFVISDSFEFEKFGRRPDYAIAQSLFTHLSADDIALCLRKLREYVKSGATLYATFLEVAERVDNLTVSDPRKNYHYTRTEMEDFGRQAGWKATYIGEWRHPRRQMMMEYATD